MMISDLMSHLLPPFSSSSNGGYCGGGSPRVSTIRGNVDEFGLEEVRRGRHHADRTPRGGHPEGGLD
jgi:hypothetical protein